jgi:hypothetical protein
VLIFVTQEHIDKGERCYVTCCPVALAIKDVAPNRQVVVSQAIRVGARAFEMQPVIARFISDFDSNRKVEPFTFELEI